MAETFDEFAGDYDSALNEGLSVSGESKEYFARGRVKWLGRVLERAGCRVGRIMDFGCGTGSATPFFLEQWPGLETVVGTDVSARSLEVARREHGSERVRFETMEGYRPDATMDLVFCNGVFHHIPVEQQAGAVKYVAESLRPGGYFALWENNPWNPGTRWVMSRIPFDREAVMVWPAQARRLMREEGLEVVRTDFLFIFPRMLGWLRPVEQWLTKLPAGGQYLVLGRKR